MIDDLLGDRDAAVVLDQGAMQCDADLARQLPVTGGQYLGLATRQEPRVEPAVMAHGDRSASQVHDLHHVRVTVIRAETVLVVASMRGSHRACGHFGDSDYLLLLHGRPPALFGVSPTLW